MRHVLETGCFCVGILCLFYYLGIVLYAGFLTSFAWIWIAGGTVLILLRFALRYQDLHKDTWLRFVTGGAFVLLAIALVLVCVVGSQVLGAMRQVPRQNLEYVIVLGAQVRGTSPSRALRRRLDRAVEYARENPDTIFILSGGQGSDEDISEAECMYRYLVGAGVSEDRLIQEADSTSTAENLRFSSAVIRALSADADRGDAYSSTESAAGAGDAYSSTEDAAGAGDAHSSAEPLGGDGDAHASTGSAAEDDDAHAPTESAAGDGAVGRTSTTGENPDVTTSENDVGVTASVGVLSNDFHIYRALLLAGQLGYTDVSGIPASSDAGMQPHNILREICAVLVMRFFP
ncbi:MAG: YdcF family protein [Lachnospiraceae bacterium]|nr:YdcF family protein [Lachnospiraceae bacterium]